MKKTILFLAAFLLSAGSLAAQTSAEGVRNVIYLIGDGMGLAQVSMLKIENGYEPTAFDRAEGVALISTYSANNRVTDSAAAGTALATGGKTNNSVLGLDSEGNALHSMMERAAERDMATGLAVVTYLQHATPAAFYAHVGNRGETEAITRDMLSSGIDVMLGGGWRNLQKPCDEGGTYAEAFARRGYRVVQSLDEAEEVSSGRLLCAVDEKEFDGFAVSERGDFLPRASRKAMELLEGIAGERGGGFLLMIEGSLIDGACHGNDAERLLAEMRDFDRTVAAAMDFADRTPGTLVVVTADHETGGLTIPSGNADFTRAESGIDYRFSTKGHTGMLVPVYLYGAGADAIRGVMDNTEHGAARSGVVRSGGHVCRNANRRRPFQGGADSPFGGLAVSAFRIRRRPSRSCRARSARRTGSAPDGESGCMAAGRRSETAFLFRVSGFRVRLRCPSPAFRPPPSRTRGIRADRRAKSACR